MFVQLLFVYIAGIFFAYYLPSLIVQHVCAAITSLLFLGLLVLNMGYRKLKVYHLKVYWGPLLYLLIFFTAAWTYLIQVQHLQTNHFSKQQAEFLKVIVDDEPQLKGDLLRFKASITHTYQDHNSLASIGKMLVTIPIQGTSVNTITYGEVLILPASYKTVNPPQNPGEFDYRNWLANHQVYHQLYVPPQKVFRLKHFAGHPLKVYAINLRKQQVAFFKKTLQHPEAFAVASTLILGYRADLSKETLAAYSATGTIHALSVSGMHVGMIYIVLHALLQFMNKSRLLKISRTLLIIGLIWFYAMLTGFSPSVLRSAFMLSTFIIGKTINRQSNSYNTMAFSAVALLIYQPLLLFDLGFQLSFLSVFGLIYLQPLLYHLIYFKALWADKLWNYTALSIAAQLTTFPLSVYYFHQFPVLFLFSNLFILLPVTLMMYIGLLMLLAKLEFLAPVLEYLINMMNTGLTWIAALPYATISSIWLQPHELILLLLLVIFGLRSFIKAQKYSLFFALCAWLCLQSSLSVKQLQARKQFKTIVFKLYKHHAVAYIQGQHALLYTDLEPESATYQYSIKPGLDLHHVTSLQIKNAPSDLKKINHL
ncbi:competence protein ComEC [Pedobacter sp. CAN_A7]|uniref:ComEC/Rec2 family competence protein n=1 Tax=Pedobacter sp. CAN_A7 TaxID=2787722 RepID=UPI0018CBC94C